MPSERLGNRYPEIKNRPTRPFGSRVASFARGGVAGALAAFAVGGVIKEVRNPNVVPSLVSNIQETGKILQHAFRITNPDVHRTFEQRVAKQLIEEAKKNGQLIKAVVINNEDPNQPVKIRLMPNFSPNNVVKKLAPGTKIEGVLVEETIGDASFDHPNVWLAIKTKNGKVVFMNLDYVMGVDGKPVLQEDTRIYNLFASGYKARR